MSSFDWLTSELHNEVVNTQSTAHSPVNCLQFSGDRILAGFEDSVVRLFDTDTRMRLWSLQRHRGCVNSLQFKDTRMVTGSDDKTIRVWDMNVGSCMEKLEGHIAPVLCVVATDRHVISGSRDHTIKLWDIERGMCLRTLRGHTGRVGGIQFVETSPTQFMTCSTDGTVKLWDLNADQRIRSYKGHKKAVVSFHLHADMIISSADDLCLKVWDKRSCKCFCTFNVANEGEVARSIVMDRKKIICGDADGVIRFRSVETGEVLRSLHAHENSVTCLQVDNSAKLLVTGSDDMTLRKWSPGSAPEATLASQPVGEPQAPASGGTPPTVAVDPLAGGLVSPAVASGDLEEKAIATLTSTTPSCVAVDAEKVVYGTQEGGLEVVDHAGTALRTLRGHDGATFCVAITKQTIVSGGADKLVRVWNTKSSSCTASAKGHADDVLCIATDGNVIVSGSADRTIKVWSMAGALVSTLSGHDSAVSALCLVDTVLVSGSTDGAVMVWDVNSATRIAVLEGHSEGVTAVCFDHLEIVSAAEDGKMIFWSTATGDLLRTVEVGEDVVVSALQFDSKKLVTTLSNGTFEIRDMESGVAVRTLPAHSGRVTGMHLHGNTMVTCAGDRAIKLWGFPSPAKLAGVASTDASVVTVAEALKFYMDEVKGKDLTGSFVNGNVVVKTVNRSTSTPLSCLHFEGNRAVTGGPDDKVVKLWDVSTGTRLNVFSGHSGGVNTVQIRGDRVLSGSDDKAIKVWDATSGSCLTTFEGHNGPVLCLQFSPEYVVSGSRDHFIKVWDMGTGRYLRTLKGHAGRITGIQLGGSNTIVSSSTDGTLKMWDLNTVARIRSFKGHTQAVSCLMFRGNTLVSGADDGTVKLWDLGTGELMKNLKGQNPLDVVNSVQFDNEKIVTACHDGAIRIRDMQSGSLLRTLPVHTDHVRVAQFDESKVVSVADDRTLRVWRFAAG